jgi:hypothetical protein
MNLERRWAMLSIRLGLFEECDTDHNPWHQERTRS